MKKNKKAHHIGATLAPNNDYTGNEMDLIVELRERLHSSVSSGDEVFELLTAYGLISIPNLKRYLINAEYRDILFNNVKSRTLSKKRIIEYLSEKYGFDEKSIEGYLPTTPHGG